MLYIKCPYCGLRAQKEFSYGGDATVKRPNINEEVSSEDWDNFVYMRKSPRGKHIELINACDKMGVKATLCTHWSNGGDGTKELASHVVDLIEQKQANFKFLYDEKTPLLKKVETVAKEIYRANEVVADSKIKDQLKSFEEAGYGNLPICVAKTQYSFSTDPNAKGAPTGHSLPIREVRLSSGAEFIVVICGAIMTMPGLPRVPAADSIKLNEKGEIEGLF